MGSTLKMWPLLFLAQVFSRQFQESLRVRSEQTPPTAPQLVSHVPRTVPVLQGISKTPKALTLSVKSLYLTEVQNTENRSRLNCRGLTPTAAGAAVARNDQSMKGEGILHGRRDTSRSEAGLELGPEELSGWAVR